MHASEYCRSLPKEPCDCKSQSFAKVSFAHNHESVDSLHSSITRELLPVKPRNHLSLVISHSELRRRATARILLSCGSRVVNHRSEPSKSVPKGLPDHLQEHISKALLLDPSNEAYLVPWSIARAVHARQQSFAAAAPTSTAAAGVEAALFC